MSTQNVNQLLDQLVRLRVGELDVAHFAQQLGVTPQPTETNPHWQFYEFDLPGGPLAHGELRLARMGGKALLSLRPREPVTLTEENLGLERWGPVHKLDINPAIPPEGTDAYIYLVNGVQVAFQLTHQTRRLRTIALQYGVTQASPRLIVRVD